jgi:hypothetical protein
MACLNGPNGRFVWVRSQPGEPAGFFNDVVRKSAAQNAVRFASRVR